LLEQTTFRVSKDTSDPPKKPSNNTKSVWENHGVRSIRNWEKTLLRPSKGNFPSWKKTKTIPLGPLIQKSERNPKARNKSSGIYIPEKGSKRIELMEKIKKRGKSV